VFRRCHRGKFLAFCLHWHQARVQGFNLKVPKEPQQSSPLLVFGAGGLFVFNQKHPPLLDFLKSKSALQSQGALSFRQL
jgi:hypothetical protein